MILSITESCSMGCIHCMNDAVSCDKHMDLATFKDSIKFFNKYGGIELIISGGEPTEHPEWIKFLTYALENARGPMNVCHVTLTTNGKYFIGNQDLQKYMMILMDKYRDFNIQITYDKRYYPEELNFDETFFYLTPVVFCNKVEYIYPMGRAKNNNLPWNSKASKCFNIRSLVRNLKSLSQATLVLATKMKFCTPRINYDGRISLGESSLCPKICNIHEGEQTIVDKICKFKCDGCSIINDNLSKEYKMAIGEE